MRSTLFLSFAFLLELLEELLGLEVLRDGLVVAGDDLVDLFLPARLGVLALADGEEELAEGRLDHGEEVIGNLGRKQREYRLVCFVFFITSGIQSCWHSCFVW